MAERRVRDISAVTVSHVCRHWRAAACSTSRLWAHVYVHPGRDDMTRMFLARAGQSPLHICLYIQARQIRSPSVPEAMDLIRPSTPRWETLHVHGGNSRAIYVAWIHLHTMPPMPLLRRIGLYAFQRTCFLSEWTPQSASAEQKLNVEKALLNGFTSLFLQGINGHTLRPLRRALNVSGNLFPQFDDICSSPLPLTYLKLSALPWYSREGAHVVLPCLQTFELDIQEDPRFVESFFKTMAGAPSLRTMSFRSRSKATWEGFEKALPGIAANFRGLHTLRLTISDSFEFGDPSDPVAFGALFDNLRQLTLEVCEDHQAVRFLRAWIRALSDGGQSMWPQLNMLAIKAPCNSQADASGASEIVTLLRTLSLADCVGGSLRILLNSRCIQTSDFTVHLVK